MIALNLGAKVSFDSRRHGRQIGTVVNFNRKAVSVAAADGRRWNVAPQFLSRAKEANSAPSYIAPSDNDPR